MRSIVRADRNSSMQHGLRSATKRTMTQAGNGMVAFYWVKHRQGVKKVPPADLHIHPIKRNHSVFIQEYTLSHRQESARVDRRPFQVFVLVHRRRSIGPIDFLAPSVCDASNSGVYPCRYFHYSRRVRGNGDSARATGGGERTRSETGGQSLMAE
jgi:hypothetical protein